MTIIEFFDGEKFIDNIVSALCFGYDKIVYIGASEIMKEPGHVTGIEFCHGA